jgi:hypothetical protein
VGGVLSLGYWAGTAGLSSSTARRKSLKSVQRGAQQSSSPLRALGLIWLALGLLFPAALPVRAADPEIDRLLQSPVDKDWVANGGNLTNQRYSTPRSNSSKAPG